MRLLTYNIHKGIGGRDRAYRIERITEVIENENPDFICLQEVDRHVKRSSFHDQPKLLAKAFNAEGECYQLNVRLRKGGYGNLVLSRWPITGKHHVSLRLRERKPRGAQIVVVETPEGPLQLVNWHLGLAQGERFWQANHLLNHHLFRAAEHLPTLIVGDFNDWRNKLAREPFFPRGFVQVTTPPSRFRTFPAYFAVGSLDKVFSRGNVFIKHARVVHSMLARRASDHLPLVVDFHLRKPV